MGIFHFGSAYLFSILSAHFTCGTLRLQSNCYLQGNWSVGWLYLSSWNGEQRSTEECFMVFLLFCMAQVYGERERKRRREEDKWGREGGKEERRQERGKEGRKEGREGDKVFFCDSLNNRMDIAHEKVILDLDRFMNWNIFQNLVVQKISFHRVMPFQLILLLVTLV